MYSTVGQRSEMMFGVLNGIASHLSTAKIIGITWTWALSVALPPLLGWSYYAPDPSGLR